MLIPFFLLKENNEEPSEIQCEKVKPITLKEAFNCSFKNKAFIYWMFTASVMTIGLQLFLGGINELFSSTGLNMTFVMASSFAPVPLTILVYNKIVKINCVVRIYEKDKGFSDRIDRYNGLCCIQGAL